MSVLARVAEAAGLTPLNAALYPSAAEDVVAAALVAVATVALARAVRTTPALVEDAKLGIVLGAAVAAFGRLSRDAGAMAATAAPALPSAPSSASSSPSSMGAAAAAVRTVAAEEAGGVGVREIAPRDNVGAAGVRTDSAQCGRRREPFLRAA